MQYELLGMAVGCLIVVTAEVIVAVRKIYYVIENGTDCLYCSYLTYDGG